jgi:hypothetical protein
MKLHYGLSTLVLVVACDAKTKQSVPTAQAEKAQTAAQAPEPTTNRVKRASFNLLAQELYVPIYWLEDKDKNETLSPDELAVVWGMTKTSASDWVQNGKFTPGFFQAYERIAKADQSGYSIESSDEKEVKRKQLVLKELSQGRPTLIASSFRTGSEEDRAIVKNVLEAATIIERLYAAQKGTSGMVEKIPANDSASRMLFYRNQGPWCVAPMTEKEEDCSALSSKPPKISGLYPESIQKDQSKFCDELAKRKDGEALLHQFFVVREAEGPYGNLKAVPYQEAYKQDMAEVSRLLKAAADAISSEGESAFKAYLSAASQSFLDGNWTPADEAWSKMNTQNSKWYLRIGPDETYFEPCSRKAGFHVSFARINQASVEWQNKLEPVKNEMEAAIAKVAGKPYKARNVSFHLPDFIDMILNAGDSRAAHGGTIGQSLPNWGPVKDEGRGRTVAMTNLGSDPDSKAALRAQVESLFCASAMSTYSEDPMGLLLGTVLHEATHNLGPDGDYKVAGKTANQIFGGPVASMLEELKAQTGALFYAEWLIEKGLVTKELVERAHTADLTWAFGHISRGMYEDGKPRPYSQLAAIQVGTMIKEGAIVWNPEEMAADKTDKGCFSFQQDKWPAAVQKLTTTVLGIKARGDKKLAEALRSELVDKDGPIKEHMALIRERWLRAPKSSYIYSVDL